MAYSNDQYRLTVLGTLGTSEQFSNTWTVIDDEGGQDVADAVVKLHDFYDEITPFQANTYTAASCQSRQLLSGLVVQHTWALITGQNTQTILPTQIAARVSLNGAGAQNGGPFIGGWAKQAVDTGGIFTTDVQTDLIEALGTLSNALFLINWRIGIDRPTVPMVTPAVRGRVGRRADVIRKRSNDLPEQYATITLS